MNCEQICKRFDQLYAERKTLDNTLQAIERFVTPYRGEFYRDLGSEHEINWRRRAIYDATAVQAAQNLASSIHSNLTSPSVMWFNLNFANPDLNVNQEARAWLDEVQNRIWATLQESDFNGEIAKTYLDIVTFGTNVLMVENMDEDNWQGLDFTATPMMDTYFELGGREKISRVYFRKRYTRLQLEQRFPDADLDQLAKEEDGDPNRRYEIILCMYERKFEKGEEPDITKPVDPLKRPVGYKWVMRHFDIELEEGGYYEMPATLARWALTSGSKYGHSPSMIALGDILQLNEFTAQISEASAKAIDPAMWTTSRGIVGDLELRAGSLVMVQRADEFGVIPEGSNFMAGEVDRARLQNSINATFGVDRLDLKESPAMTATEVMARLERMLRLFAPVLGGLEATLLNPIIEITYAALGRAGQLPEKPASLSDEANIDIEYTGPMPRAMKSDIANGTEMWLALVHQIAQMKPEVLDLIDYDMLVRGQADMRGVPAKYTTSEDDVEAMRKERAQQQQEAMELQKQMMAGEALQSLGAGAEAVQNTGLESVA